jgi:hypothetical protein
MSPLAPGTGSNTSPRVRSGFAPLCIVVRMHYGNRADWITSAQEAEVAAAESDVERNETTVLAYWASTYSRAIRTMWP